VSDDFGRFLADRYDEAEARERKMLEMLAKADPDRGPRLAICFDDGTSGDAFDWNPWDVITDYDPAHRLADIKLKRAILALHHPDGDKWPDCKECSCRGALAATDCGGTVPWPCATARQLGTEFSDHPGYRPEWAPEGETDGT
jgi:hypothetical protein